MLTLKRGSNRVSQLNGKAAGDTWHEISVSVRCEIFVRNVCSIQKEVFKR